MSLLKNIALNARIVCGATLLALGAVIMPEEDLCSLLKSYQRQLDRKRGA